MKSIVIILSLIVSASIETAQAQMKGDTYHLPAIDVTAEKNIKPETKGPIKYGINSLVNDIKISQGVASNGVWRDLKNGYSEWSINIQAENATSLDFGFKDFYLPPTAELTVVNSDKTVTKGPYTGSVNKKHGHFWPGTVPGNSALLKITISNAYKKYLSFDLFNIPRGFYKFWEQPIDNKSLACNIDVSCPEGDDWQSQTSSVARYSFATSAGTSLCTGQLVNNTSQDGSPYFLTANHCEYENVNTLAQKQAIAASMNIWWNYQSLSCRAPGSAQSGIQISVSGFNDTQSGATYIANNAVSDFALVRLNQSPSVSYGTELTGWDRRNIAPNFAVSIHHPLGHAKRIAIENSPLTIFTPTPPTGGTNTHLRVFEWDEGLTEQGSSGGGLWNADGLLVGQLHFGTLANTCSDTVTDGYGRFFTSWDNGNDAQSRLKDWLDPINTGQQTLQGTGGCEAPSVSIVNNSTNSVGDLLAFSSQVSGGAGGYSYAWDVNADAGTDATTADIQARYNQQFVGNINLTVTDSAGCQANASKAVVVTSADVQLQDVDFIRENLDQVCGNNDNFIDPGERWSSLLIAENTGSKTANDAYLALGKNRSAVTDGQNDTFGNTVSNCDRLFIDISNTGSLKTWESAGTQYTADDEGSTLIQLSQAFDHYGQSVSSLRASTNGYFSTSAAADGSDWSPDCPLPAAPERDTNGARIAPLHMDMKASSFYHQTFSTCPRPAETGENLSCEVFTWQGADIYSNSNSTVEDIDIQAILYPATSQWVYQYAGNGFNGSDSTTGMQNTAASDGLSYACNTANSINTSEAVCTFNKNHQPGSSGAEFVMLESPVISLGDLLVNQSQSRNMNFAISEDATCGATFGINHQASVYDQGFNAGQNNILTHAIGNNGQCNVVTNCGVGTADEANNDIVPRRGLWWNPVRDGNGFDLYTIGANRLVYFFYTGVANGEPVWYLANDADSNYDQYYNDITKYSVPGGFGNGDVGFEIVGWSNTSFIDDSNAIQVREIGGQLSAEKQYFFQYGADNTPNMHTGSYFTPSENGWGHSVGTLGNSRVSINYIYDQQGNPYWTIGNGPNDNSAFAVYYANTFCPSCPAVAGEYKEVGEIKLTINGQTTGTLNYYNVTDEGVSWNKTNLYIENLIPPN